MVKLTKKCYRHLITQLRNILNWLHLWLEILNLDCSISYFVPSSAENCLSFYCYILTEKNTYNITSNEKKQYTNISLLPVKTLSNGLFLLISCKYICSRKNDLEKNIHKYVVRIKIFHVGYNDLRVNPSVCRWDDILKKWFKDSSCLPLFWKYYINLLIFWK